MSDRLHELRRQRELLREHAAWLDREIAAAESGATPTPAPVALPPLPSLPSLPMVPQPTPAATRPPVGVPDTIDAEALLRRYGSDPTMSQIAVKRGCWAAFAAAMTLLAVIVAAWYLLRQR